VSGTDDPFAHGLPTLEATRVRLRAMRAEDAPALMAIYGDALVARWGFDPPMKTLDDAMALVLSCARLAAERTLFHWGMAQVEDDVIIGHTTLFQVDRENRRCEIGYSLRRDLWGRGLATEAVGRVIDFAFGPLDLRRLEADVDPRNEGSLRVLAKLGFVREGLFRERWEKNGEVEDAVMLGLLRRERR
jgi:ribosomal-protein-alanine N-acetyltransferase